MRIPVLLVFIVIGGMAKPAGGQTAPATRTITTPSEHLDRPLGVDFDLADWDEVGGYLRRLGEESPRVQTSVAGTTTEGREFLISVISSEANLARLDEIRRGARILADPRDRTPAEREDAVLNGKTILFVSCAMHSNEAAGAEFGMGMAHALASSDESPWREAREEIVTVLYITNPDGVDHVTEWYRRTAGTPHEAADLLKLYQYYSGHDNNRDWFMLTQAETRIVTDLLYNKWFPQVYWDVHQQGSRRERFFVPPFRDPLNPNLDPTIIGGIDVLGSRALLDMTREGLTGISTGVSYDMWWNGGNRNVPVRHNIVGLLTEAASVRLASPIFLRQSDLSPPRGLDAYVPSNRFPAPWPGGWWRLRDIIDYEMSFARSLLGSLAREGDYWRRVSLEASVRSIEAETAPYAWLIPSDNRDPAAVQRLTEVLLLSGVEVQVSRDPIEADGRQYPAGTLVIERQQPYGAHVKDLFDVQRYPEGPPPYDVAGWTLPFLLGVRRVEVMTPVTGPLRQIERADDAVAAFTGDARADGETLSTRHSDAWRRLTERLAEGRRVALVTEGERAGLIVSDAGRESAVVMDRLPRFGVYAPWSGSMDEGWLRYVLDSNGIPYVRVRNEMLRAGALDDFLDVLLIPSVGARQLDAGRSPGSVPEAFARGLDPEGAVAVESFVREGGTLIAIGAAAGWAVDLLQLPVVDVTQDAAGRAFSCPGSVLRAVPQGGHTATTDLPGSIPLFFSRSSAFRVMNQAERKTAGREKTPAPTVLLRYAPSRTLLSGWIDKPEVIAGKAAWMRATVGKGRVHLFAFRPQYRGWSQGAFHLLFRAMFVNR